jgi:hypothetical protein
MVTIDGRELVYSESFMARDDQVVELIVPLAATPLRLSLVFEAGEGGERTASWTTADGVTQVRFKGWSNAIGTAFREPSRLGEVGGRALWFQVAHHRIGDSNLVHFYLLLGGENG